MVAQAKETVSQIAVDTKTAAKNFVRLIEAASLLTVGSYSVYAAYHAKMTSWAASGLTVAAVIIGVRGAYEFLRHLANK